MTNHPNDSQHPPSPQGQVNAWFRLFFVMAVPVLLLLTVIFFSR
jgi:hypothetical protein